MSYNNNNDKKKKKKPVVPPPSYHVSGPGPNISFSNDDDVGEETTRRVGGGGGAGIAFQPSLAPMNPSFGGGMSMQPAPSFSGMGSMQPAPFIDTTQSKGGGYRQSAPAPSFKPAAPVAVNKRPFVGGWDLKDVPTLGDFHPLERTSVVVQNTPVSTIATRISKVLQERSIDAIYDNHKAKATCMTDDQVDFRIRLYKERTQSRNRGIIVEVQRRFGTSVNFHDDTTAILNAAQGKQQTSRKPPVADTIATVSDSEDEADTAPSGTDSLTLVQNMFRNPSYDGKVLALQTLSSLTDSKKMGRSTAYKVSSKLLQPHNVVGSKVISIVLDPKQSQRTLHRSNSDSSCESDDEDDCDTVNRQNEEVRLLAFTSLTNALGIVDRHSISSILRERLYPVLIEDLQNASYNVRFAYLAATCMKHIGYLQSSSSSDKTEIYNALEIALQVGEARHAGLARQVLSLLR